MFQKVPTRPALHFLAISIGIVAILAFYFFGSGAATVQSEGDEADLTFDTLRDHIGDAE